MSIQNPAEPQEFNLAMREKIAALGHTPAIQDTQASLATNLLWRQLLFLLGGPSAIGTFVLRPGVAPIPEAGIYDNWPDLYAVAVQSPGPVTIYFDNAFIPGGVITIPAGNWNFPRRDVTFCGANANAEALVRIVVEGESQLNGLVRIDNFIELESQNQLGPLITSTPTVAFGQLSVFILGLACRVLTTGSPVIRVNSDDSFAVGLIGSAELGGGTIEVIDGTLGFSPIVIFCFGDAIVGSGAISSTGPNTLLFFLLVTAARSTDFAGQFGFLGAVFTDFIEAADRMQYNENNTADWSGVPPLNVANALDRIAAQIGPIP